MLFYQFQGILPFSLAGAGGNITRLMLLEAGFPSFIPAITIDVQCASGLESIAMAAAKITLLLLQSNSLNKNQNITQLEYFLKKKYRNL